MTVSGTVGDGAGPSVCAAWLHASGGRDHIPDLRQDPIREDHAPERAADHNHPPGEAAHRGWWPAAKEVVRLSANDKSDVDESHWH